MAEAAPDGGLDLTVADPDLNLGKIPGVSIDNGGWYALGPQRLRVTLHGAWRLTEATGTVCAWRLPEARENVRVVSDSAGETVLEILCQHGASYEMKLAR